MAHLGTGVLLHGVDDPPLLHGVRRTVGGLQRVDISGLPVLGGRQHRRWGNSQISARVLSWGDQSCTLCSLCVQ